MNIVGKISLSLLMFCGVVMISSAQTKPMPSRPLTMAEYEKAKAFDIKDLDKDTYVKFENAYILDRYESKKPYFVTGDDSLRKRFDLYKLIAKDSLQELGVMVFYTNEKGKLYKTIVPGQHSDSKVWEHYFEDIHAIDKEEKNFVLKLSYILSKEFSFQLYKAEGNVVKKEDGTYGMDICFPGDDLVTMANGSSKFLKDILPGDKVVTIDPRTRKSTTTTVKELTTHPAENYAITELLLVNIVERESATEKDVFLKSKILKATPNHPVTTNLQTKELGKVIPGERILCLNEHTNNYEEYTVWNKKEEAGGMQKVYNIIAKDGETFIMNSVMVMQKMLIE